MRSKSPTVTVTVPGTCGELIQGWSADWEEPVLVSCPITLYNRVCVRLCPGPDVNIPNSRKNYTKSRRAARLLLDYLGRPDLGAEIYLSSQLRPGCGMASSTADIVGVMTGLATALNTKLSPGELARLACQIEPSDSMMFSGLALLAYRGSSRYDELGPVPSLPLLMLDPGQTVDTLTYNARLNLAATRALAPSTGAAIKMLKQGLANNDAAAIGAAATLSALSYQTVNYNPLLEQVQHWANQTGALGIARAHSGSVFGLLYAVDADPAEPARWLSSRFSGNITPTRLTGGSYLECVPPPAFSRRYSARNTGTHAIFAEHREVSAT
jgi:L-threonine kinase